MPINPHLRRAGLLTLAILYAVAVTLYCALSLYASRLQVAVELGFENEYIPSEHCELVRSVVSRSPAEEAGLRPGDRIVAINGRQIQDSFTLTDIWSRHLPGDTVLLTVERTGASRPIELKATFRSRVVISREGRLTRTLNRWVTDAFFLPFLVVGLAVLFLRLDDFNAWLLALMFGTFIAAPTFPASYGFLSPILRSLAMTYRATFVSLIGGLFYFFFAVFPERSPLDRRVPWLKWVGLGLGIATALPGWRSGDQSVPGAILRLVGTQRADLSRFGYTYGFIGLGVISLVANAVRMAEPEAR